MSSLTPQNLYGTNRHMKQTHATPTDFPDIDELVNLLAASSLLKEKTRINLYLPKAVVKIMDAMAKNQSRSELVKTLVVEKAKKTEIAKRKSYFGALSHAKITDKDIDDVIAQWDRHLEKVVNEL